MKRIEKFESCLSQLSMFISGLFGEELGMTNGTIRDDQISISDASDSSLKFPRIGKSSWNPVRVIILLILI